MKYLFILITGLLFSVKIYAQEPVFLSPYKSGKPVPESAKDYSKPVPVNLLNGGAAKQSVSPAANKTNMVPEPKNEPADKKKPVMQSSSKREVKN